MPAKQWIFNLRNALRWLREPANFFGIGAVLAVAVPAVVFGPWLPFHDLVAFVALDTIPAGQAYGPVHFEPLQFTYVLHLVVSRALSAFGVTAPAQVVGFYLFQGLVFVGVLWRLVRAVVPNAWASSCAVAFGALAFWEGQFLFGGPLPFSLGAALQSIATLLVILEAGAGGPATGYWVGGLLGLSVISHPFALPLAFVTLALRFAFVPRRRWQTVGVALMLVALGVVVVRDSPSDDIAAGVWARALLTTDPWRLWERLQEMFIGDAWFTGYLFGDTPTRLYVYFVALASIRFVGFVVSPFVAVSAKDNPSLRALATLNTLVGLLYFLTPSLKELLPWWAHRVLACYGPFTFVAGIVAVGHLVRRLPAKRWRERLADARWVWAAPVLALGWVAWNQSPLLRHSRDVQRNFEQVRGEILKSGLTNSFLVVSDLNTIRPAYLRCVSFLLFSDRQILDRHLNVFTEWHGQDRHPTRQIERWFLLGRRQVVASFFINDTGVHVALRESPPGEFAVAENNSDLELDAIAKAESKKGLWLLTAGYYRDAIAHFRSSLRAADNDAAVHSNLGVALLRSGDLTNAAEEFRAAIRIAPALINAHNNLAFVLRESGQKADAVAEYREVLRLDPGNQVARAALARLGQGS